MTTISRVFVEEYHWSIGESGLSYIGIGIGFILGVILIGSTSDGVVAKHALKNNNVPMPEVRLKVCVYFSFLIPISFLWYGWAAEKHTFWLAAITGLVAFGFGMIGIFLPVQTYMIDAFPEYAASSTAALASSRNVVGTFLPLAGPYLCKLYLCAPVFFYHCSRSRNYSLIISGGFPDNAIGLGFGNTLLAGVAFVLIPAPYLIAK